VLNFSKTFVVFLNFFLASTVFAQTENTSVTCLSLLNPDIDLDLRRSRSLRQDSYSALIEALKNDEGEFKNALFLKSLDEIDSVDTSPTVFKGTRPFLLQQLSTKRRNLLGYYSLKTEDFKSIIHFLFSGTEWVFTNTSLDLKQLLEIVDFGIGLGFDVEKIKRIDLGGTDVSPGVLRELHDRGFRLNEFQPPFTESLVSPQKGEDSWLDDLVKMPTLKKLNLSFFVEIETNEIFEVFKNLDLKEVTFSELQEYKRDYILEQVWSKAEEASSKLFSGPKQSKVFDEIYANVMLKNLLHRVDDLENLELKDLIEVIKTRWKVANFEWQLGDDTEAFDQKNPRVFLIAKFMDQRVFPELVSKLTSERTRSDRFLNKLNESFDEKDLAKLKKEVFKLKYSESLGEYSSAISQMLPTYLVTKIDFFAQITKVKAVNLDYDKVSDGDTAHLSVEKNGVYDTQAVRFLYLDTAEKSSLAKTKVEAFMSRAATMALIYFFSNADKITVSSMDFVNDGKEGRGRYLFDAVLEGPWGVRTFGSLMLESGLAVFYNGEGKRPEVDWESYYTKDPELFEYWGSEVWASPRYKTKVPKKYTLP
jgi:endonuclease YncB( thermonuclease family)